MEYRVLFGVIVMMGMVELTLCRKIKLVLCQPASCLDIYKEDCRSLSGEYAIYSGNQAMRVFCSFEGDYVYTFISRTASGTSFDISTLYSTAKFVQVRHVDENGVQKKVRMENLSTFPSQDLAIELGSTPSTYQGPRTNTQLFPYIFLGFLPKRLANAKTTQGYRADGTDFTFRNCDSNANSYMSFFLDPNSGSFNGVGNANSFMRRWIVNSVPIPYPEYMPKDYFMKFEFHMGGCGALMTLQAANVLAALGLAQALPTETCAAPTCFTGDNW